MFVLRFFRSFLPFHPHKELKEIYASVVIKQLAIGLVGIFEPIYLFQIFGNSVAYVLIFFGASYALQALGVPLGAKLMQQVGLKHTFLLSVPFLFFYYLILWRLEAGLDLALVALAVIMVAAYRISFWPAFHTDFTRHSQKAQRAREHSLFMILGRGIMLAAPVSGGLIIANFGFGALFLVVLALLLASMIPLFLSADWKEHYSDSYFQAFGRIFQPKYWRQAVAYAALGIDASLSFLIWPIFMFSLSIAFDQIGLISSVAIGAGILTALFVGRLTDHLGQRQRLIKIGALVNFFVNLLRMVPRSLGAFFAVDALGKMADQLVITPFQARVYDLAAAQKDRADEYLIFREISMASGRALGLFGGAVFLSLVPFEQIWLIFGLIAPLSFLFPWL
jgi:MFS family permease